MYIHVCVRERERVRESEGGKERGINGLPVAVDMVIEPRCAVILEASCVSSVGITATVRYLANHRSISFTVDCLCLHCKASSSPITYPISSEHGVVAPSRYTQHSSPTTAAMEG